MVSKRKQPARRDDEKGAGDQGRHTGGRGEGTEPIEIPRWLPPGLYALLTLFVFREFVLTDRMLVGSDTLAMGYVVRDLYAEALRTLGRVPGWAPHILGGTPFLEALSGGDALYPPSLLLLLITETYRALGWKLVLHVFAAGLLFFGWIRSIGGSRAAALLGGTAYMLAPFLVGFVQPGHDGKIFVTALAPLLFWAVERHFSKPGLRSLAAIGLVVSLVIFTTHFQMAYFLFGGVGLYAIFRSIQISRGRDEVVAARGTRTAGVRFSLFMAASLLGAAGAAYQFIPAADYVTEHSRRIQTTREAAGQTGRAWSSSFSMHPEEVMSLVVPEFAGNGAGGAAWAEGTYWGRNPLKDNHEYAGLIVLLLAAASFVGARRRQLRWFFTGLGLLGLSFALGGHTPVWGLLYEIMPGIRLFRAPGMVAYLFGFSAITLAALGLDRIVELAGGHNSGDARSAATTAEGEAELRKIQKVLWVACGLIAALALLIGSGAWTSVWTSIVYREIDAQRLQTLQAHLPNIVRGASAALLLAAATAGLVAGLARRRIPPGMALAALVFLVAVDEARVDEAFVETLDFYEWSATDPNIRTILEREDGGEPYRLFSLARGGQDVSPAMRGIELAAGHHPNDLSRYRELIGMVGSGLPENLLHPNVRRILNVRYILWPDIELGPAPAGPIVSRTQYGGGEPYHTLLADQGLPRARLVGEAVVKGDNEAVDYILGDQHDPAREVVLAAEAPIELTGDVTGSVEWVERGPDRLVLRVVSDGPALLVIADNWFPAWRARVDGADTEVLRAYHSVRAVPVPAGSSTVEMWYESELLERSGLLSFVALLGLAVCGAVGVLRDRSEASA